MSRLGIVCGLILCRLVGHDVVIQGGWAWCRRGFCDWHERLGDVE